MNKETPTADMQTQINSLQARVTALESWVAWFKGYLLSHPGGIPLLGTQPPGEEGKP